MRRADDHRDVGVVTVEIDALKMREGREVTAIGRDVILARQELSDEGAVNVRTITSVDGLDDERRERSSIRYAMVDRIHAHFHFNCRNIQFLDHRLADDVTIRPRIQHPVDDLRAARRWMKDADWNDGANNFVLSDDGTVRRRRR